MFNESLSQVAVIGREWFYHAGCVSLFPQIFKFNQCENLEKIFSQSVALIFGRIARFSENKNITYCESHLLYKC